MKKLLILLCLALPGAAAAQIVGEAAIGLQLGVRDTPTGLNYRYIMTDHMGISAVLGADRLMSGGAYDTGGPLGRGALVAGVGLQPILIRGGRHSSSCLYADTQIRLRLALSDAVKKKLSPALSLHIGYNLELTDGLEGFIEAGPQFYSPSGEIELNSETKSTYSFGGEACIGIRFRLN